MYVMGRRRRNEKAPQTRSHCNGTGYKIYRWMMMLGPGSSQPAAEEQDEEDEGKQKKSGDQVVQKIGSSLWSPLTENLKLRLLLYLLDLFPRLTSLLFSPLLCSSILFYTLLLLPHPVIQCYHDLVLFSITVTCIRSSSASSFGVLSKKVFFALQKKSH